MTWWQTVRGLPKRVSLFAYLGSSMFYRDALNALYGFGGTYAVLVLDWSITQVGIFGIVGAMTSAVATWLGGKADTRAGAETGHHRRGPDADRRLRPDRRHDARKPVGRCAGEGSSVPDITFYICGAIIGGAGGVLQSASRTMMCRHAPPARPTEAFGLYALSGKATAFLGPALIGLTTS
jgi:UMF1 family MFS transporter